MDVGKAAALVEIAFFGPFLIWGYGIVLRDMQATKLGSIGMQAVSVFGTVAASVMLAWFVLHSPAFQRSHGAGAVYSAAP